MTMSGASAAAAARPAFDKELHALYFLKNLKTLPTPYASQDNQRVVLAFFCIHGLAVLGELDRVDRKQIIEWVYSLQLHPDSRDHSLNASECGFRGGTAFGNVFGCAAAEYESEAYDTSNIASTYAALCILKTLGDDLSRVDKPAIINALRHLQDKTIGSFQSLPFGSEQDMRFVYCACAISYLLDDWSGIDLPAMVRFINSCISYDGSIGINADAEGQGGAVFCAIASLVLSGRLMQFQGDLADLTRWLLFRQQGGFQGRCNKTPDTCYAFWNGATLELLGKHDLVDIPSCQAFILSCQFPFGGLCKYPDAVPDVMHSYYSLAWLSIAAAQKRERNAETNVQNDGDGGVVAEAVNDPFDCLVALDAKLQIPFFPTPS